MPAAVCQPRAAAQTVGARPSAAEPVRPRTQTSPPSSATFSEHSGTSQPLDASPPRHLPVHAPFTTSPPLPPDSATACSPTCPHPGMPSVDHGVPRRDCGMGCHEDASQLDRDTHPGAAPPQHRPHCKPPSALPSVPQLPGQRRPTRTHPVSPVPESPQRPHTTRSQPLSLGRNVNLHNTKICNHITKSVQKQSSIQHPHLLEVTSIKLHQGNLIISEEQTNGGCLHDFIESLHAAGQRQSGGGGSGAAEFAAARLCVARNVLQQMAIVVEFLHLKGLWGLGLTPRSFFLNWTPAKCLIIKLRLPMLSLVTINAAIAAGTETETKMREDDVRSVFLLSLYVLLGPHWNKRPDVTQEPEKGFIGALPLWSVPSDEDIAAMPESHMKFVRLARATVLAKSGEVLPVADLKRSQFFQQDLPKGAEFMNEQLLQKPPNAKREKAAEMVSNLVSSALKALQRESGPFGMLPPSAPQRQRHLI